MKKSIITLLIINTLSPIYGSWKGEMFFGIVGLFGAFALDIQSREFDETKRGSKFEQVNAYNLGWSYKATSDSNKEAAAKEYARFGDNEYYRSYLYWAWYYNNESITAMKSSEGFAKNIDIADDNANQYRNATYIVGISSVILLIKSMFSYQKEQKRKCKSTHIGIHYDAHLNGGKLQYNY